jgi:hypothetical protein
VPGTAYHRATALWCPNPIIDLARPLKPDGGGLDKKASHSKIELKAKALAHLDKHFPQGEWLPSCALQQATTYCKTTWTGVNHQRPSQLQTLQFWQSTGQGTPFQVRRSQIESWLPARHYEQSRRRSHNLLDNSREEWLKKPSLHQKKIKNTKGKDCKYLEHFQETKWPSFFDLKKANISFEWKSREHLKVKPHPDVMFKDVCCHLSGHDVVDDKFAEGGEEVAALVQLLNFGVLVGI